MIHRRATTSSSPSTSRRSASSLATILTRRRPPHGLARGIDPSCRNGPSNDAAVRRARVAAAVIAADRARAQGAVGRARTSLPVADRRWRCSRALLHPLRPRGARARVTTAVAPRVAPGARRTTRALDRGGGRRPHQPTQAGLVRYTLVRQCFEVLEMLRAVAGRPSPRRGDLGVTNEGDAGRIAPSDGRPPPCAAPRAVICSRHATTRCASLEGGRDQRRSMTVAPDADGGSSDVGGG